MVDGRPTVASAPGAYKKEFYVADHNSRINLGEVPLQALSRKTKAQLSQLLNGIKILPSEEGFLRDWRGLAHCAKIKSEMVTFLAERPDPTKELFEHWAKQPNGGCTLGDLQVFLGHIDRWDVIDDTNVDFLTDAEQYLELIQHRKLLVTKSSEGDQESLNEDRKSSADDQEEKILTEDDVKLAQRGLPPQQYHAFVLYADEDVEFAAELIERMESAGLKLCEKSRDLLGGSISHDAILRLIRERCNRLIVIVSPAFLESRANNFFMTYAQALGIEQRRRKIVPCIYKRCILPPQLNFYFALHYENRGKLFNFWDKLQQSIQSQDNYTAPASSVGVLSPKITITEIDSVSRVEMVRGLAGPQIFPPPPKLRSGSSMFDLSATELELHDDHGTLSKSNDSKKSPSFLSRFRLDDKGKSKSFWDLSPTKSTVISSNPEVVDALSPLSPISPITATTSWSSPKKLKWYKKIIPPKSSDKKVKSVVPGDMTPTSTRSFDSELFLTPEGSESHKKKKKKKLLAW